MLGIALSRLRVYSLAFTSTTLLPMDSVMLFLAVGGEWKRFEAFRGGLISFKCPRLFFTFMTQIVYNRDFTN